MAQDDLDRPIDEQAEDDPSFTVRVVAGQEIASASHGLVHGDKRVQHHPQASGWQVRPALDWREDRARCRVTLDSVRLDTAESHWHTRVAANMPVLLVPLGV